MTILSALTPSKRKAGDAGGSPDMERSKDEDQATQAYARTSRVSGSEDSLSTARKPTPPATAVVSNSMIATRILRKDATNGNDVSSQRTSAIQTEHDKRMSLSYISNGNGNQSKSFLDLEEENESLHVAKFQLEDERKQDKEALEIPQGELRRFRAAKDDLIALRRLRMTARECRAEISGYQTAWKEVHADLVEARTKQEKAEKKANDYMKENLSFRKEMAELRAKVEAVEKGAGGA